MPADAPTILATSGGYRRGRRTQLEFDALVHHAVELSGAHGRRPRVTFVGTASGDPRFMNYWALEAGRVAGFDVTCLDLFPMPNLDDVPGHLLQADVVWVNGGSVANLLAVWDVHDLRPAMRAAWEAGVVLSGVSAGAICWYVGGCTDSFGPRAARGDQRAGPAPLRQRRPLRLGGGSVARRSTPSSATGPCPRRTAATTGSGWSTAAPSSSRRSAVTEGKGAYVVSRERDASGAGWAVREERLEPRRLPPLTD